MKNIKLITSLLFFSIYFGAQAQTKTPEIKKKQINQQQRIDQGVASGELTPEEAKKLKMQQAKFRRNKTMAKSDGVITPAERAKLRQQQKRADQAIYKEKHDAQKR